MSYEKKLYDLAQQILVEHGANAESYAFNKWIESAEGTSHAEAKKWLHIYSAVKTLIKNKNIKNLQ